MKYFWCAASAPLPQDGDWRDALRLFYEARAAGLGLDAITYSATVAACERGRAPRESAAAVLRDAYRLRLAGQGPLAAGGGGGGASDSGRFMHYFDSSILCTMRFESECIVVVKTLWFVVSACLPSGVPTSLLPVGVCD